MCTPLSSGFNASINHSYLKNSSYHSWLFPSLDSGGNTRIGSCDIFDMITPDDIRIKMPERFWNKIKFGEPDDCWEWQSQLNFTGYGVYTVTTKVQVGAHRHLYMALFGELPSKIFVCHSCDNPKCVNPNHLWAGTIQENNADRERKGRRIVPCGSNNWLSKFTNDDIFDIKILKTNGEPNYVIASKFGVSVSVIQRIISGETYYDVAPHLHKLFYTRLRPNRASKYKGVAIKNDKSGTYWQVTGHINGRETYIGVYKNELDAAKAYNEWAVKNGLPENENKRRLIKGRKSKVH